MVCINKSLNNQDTCETRCVLLGRNCVYIFLIFTLKELRNCSQKFIFAFATKIGEKERNQHSKLLFLKKIIQFGTGKIKNLHEEN